MRACINNVFFTYKHALLDGLFHKWQTSQVVGLNDLHMTRWTGLEVQHYVHVGGANNWPMKLLVGIIGGNRLGRVEASLSLSLSSIMPLVPLKKVLFVSSEVIKRLFVRQIVQ